MMSEHALYFNNAKNNSECLAIGPKSSFAIFGMAILFDTSLDREAKELPKKAILSATKNLKVK